MKRPKPYIFIIIVIIATIAAQFPLIALAKYLGLNTKNLTPYLLIGMLISTIFIANIKNIFSLFQKAKVFIIQYRRSIVILASFITLQLGVLILSYYIYYSNPNESFVLSDEISKRHEEIAKRTLQNEIEFLKRTKIEANDQELRWIYLDRQLRLKEKDEKRKSKALLITDSLIVSFENIFQPPGAGPSYSINIYDKTGEFLISEYCSGENFEAAFNERFEEIKKASSLYTNQLRKKEISAYDNRWSFLSFTSYYIRDQLQPMTSLLIVLDNIFSISKWIFGFIIAGASVWKYLGFHGERKSDDES